MSTNQTHGREFGQFPLARGAPASGDFEIKSGRRTADFVDIGRISAGKEIRRLAAFYARTIRDSPSPPRSPAEKEQERDVSFDFNRKEAKDHGEGASLVGHALRGENVSSSSRT